MGRAPLSAGDLAITRSGPPGTELEIVEDELDEVVPTPAEGLAALVFTSAALVLLVLAPFATRQQPAGKGWYLAPVNWPAISLGLVIVAGAVLGWRFFSAFRSATDKAGFRRDALWSLGGMGQALEYSLWFCLYLLAVSNLGFAIATLAFLQFVVWRAGLRGSKWVLTAFLITVGIVVIFRLGIGLWFPLAPIFRLLPDWVGNNFGSIL